MTTTIEWVINPDGTKGEVWNPVTGCTKVSAGCKNCYAERRAKRFWKDRKFMDVRCHPERLDQPLHWKKPRRVFVNSMSDLFHPDVPVPFIAQVFNIMASWALTCRKKDCDHDDPDCWHDPGHIYQILTKRPERMMKVLQDDFPFEVGQFWPGDSAISMAMETETWPLSNVWLGVSCENQETADERIPILLQTPAAVRFASCEPLLAPVNLDGYLANHSWEHGVPGGLNWIIVGGESGPDHRPLDITWIQTIVRQCEVAGIPVFVKQDSGLRPGQQGRISDCLWKKEFPR